MQTSNQIPAPRRFVGLDVHKRIVQACILDAGGKLLTQQRFPCTAEQLTGFARCHLDADTPVVLEATSNTWAIVDVLASASPAPIHVSNPMRTRAIASAKIKTDRIDARVLADLMRAGYLPQVWQPDGATRALRRQAAHRAALVAQRTACKNRLHAILAQRLIVCPHADLFGKAGLAWLNAIELDPAGILARSVELQILTTLNEQLDRLEAEQAKYAYSDARVRLLMTLPGVDQTVALALIAAWGDIARFDGPERASSYLGLTPSTHASADKCYHGPITKQGNSRARWLLVQAAQHLDKHPGPLGIQFKRLQARKNRNVAVVAMARKLACIAYLMLVRGEPYRYATPDTTQTKLTRLRVAATGVKRRGGVPKGTPRSHSYGTYQNTRVQCGIDQVLANEDVPPRHPLAPGEQRMLHDLGLGQLPDKLGAARLKRRSRLSDTD